MPPNPPSSAPSLDGLAPQPDSVSSHSSARSPRVLACARCQQRKVRCDRAFPCQNCSRQGIECVPASLAKRRRTRRYPERALLDRLHSYERLLRQNNIEFESLFLTLGQSQAGGDDDDQSQDEESQGLVTSAPPSPPEIRSETVSHTSKNIMSSLNPVFRELDKDTIHDTIRKVWERLSAQKEGFFLPRQNQPVIDVSVLHPDAATIFRLWQVYLDGVDPLFKVTHAPSLQARIVESASSIRDTDPSLQALMFSIYCIAIYSMPDDKCQATFASSRDSLLEMYHAACEQALMNCGFLNTDNRDCLTALFLYLLTLGYAVDPRSLFSISGICMRIAQRMQLDRELPNDKVTPFEAEMRRRLWWAIVVFDVRLSELVHYRPAALDPTWDCHIPLNVNDCDLHPQMKAAPSVQDSRPSEAIFCVVRGELGDFLRHAEYFLDLTNPSLRILARDRLKGRASASSQGADAAGDKGKDLDDTYKAERKIKEKYLHLCSPENSLHWMTMQTTRGFLARCRLVKFASRYSSESTEPTEIMRDAAFADALTVMECDTQIMTSPNTARFKWFTSYYFPLPAYVHICRDLVKRVKGELAVQAWQIMTENYESHFVSVTARSRSMHELLAQVILHMWDECQANFEDKTGSKPPHKLILKIRETMAEYEALCENRVDPVSSTDAILRPLSLPLDFNSSGNFYPMGTSQPSEFPMTTTPGIFSNPVSSTSTPLDFGLNNTCWPSNTPWAWRGPRPGW